MRSEGDRANTEVARGVHALGCARCGLVTVVFGVWWLANVLVGPNLHTVIPGRVIVRPPTPEALRRIVRNHGIRTIVNLRAAAILLPWYLAEGQAAPALGSSGRLSFSAVHLPPPTSCPSHRGA